MDSSSAASVESGAGPGSLSTSKPDLVATGTSVTGGALGGENDGADVFNPGADGANGRAGLGCVTAAATGCSGETGAEPAGLAESALRSRPRATRSVPLDCSTLM